MQESLPTEESETTGVSWEAAEETTADRDGVSEWDRVVTKLLDKVA